MYKEKSFKVILLAAGSGLRMGTRIKKQYLELKEKPMLVYSLMAFEHSPVDEIILVVKAGEEDFCQKEMIKKYGIHKVKQIISGGDSRYHSTAKGLCTAAPCDYVLIHDAARPCLTQAVILRCMESVLKYSACTAGVAAVDTINQVHPSGKILQTLDRNQLWLVQTPQAFRFDLIMAAHNQLKAKEAGMSQEEKNTITDDVKIVQLFMGQEVFMVEGSYQNIKVTTSADLKIAETFLEAGDF